MDGLILRQIPNFITVVRVLLIAPLAYWLWLGEYRLALIVFMIAGFSDALDGFLAKRFNWGSRFGAIMDPLADKMLLVTTMLVLTLQHHISYLLFALVVARDVIIVAGAYAYHKVLGPYDMAPSRLSKFNTLVQILLLLALLFSLGVQSLPAWSLQALIILVYITTLSSGINYIIVWGGRYRRSKRRAAKLGRASESKS